MLVDLQRMPHLLIAGTTGSGKSVAINTMILSLVYRLRPDQCRLIMVDPKMLELSVYDGIPHLLTPVVTDPKKAVVALKWAVREMEERYKKMSKLGVRNIDGYNARLAEAKSKGEKLSRTVHTGYDRESGEAIYENEELDLEPLPYIVVIVDEMADLMMVAGKDIEGAVQRLAQMARAAGLHVILATQRPSVDVITGTIKADISRPVYRSRLRQRSTAAPSLANKAPSSSSARATCSTWSAAAVSPYTAGEFVSDEEVDGGAQVEVARRAGISRSGDCRRSAGRNGNPIFNSTAMGAGEGGDLYRQAVAIVTRDRKASTSYISGDLQIGYHRAPR